MGRCGMSVSGVFSQIWYSKHSGESWMMCVCWRLGWVELRVGSNIMIFFFVHIAASHTAHVLYIFCVYIYIHC